MNVSFCKVGPIRTNCYLVEGEGGCMMVDPGDDPVALIDFIGDRKLDVVAVTHWHDDHIGALADVVRATGAKVYVGRIDADNIRNARRGAVDNFDMLLDDGDTFDVGDMHVEVLHTPGHTEGSVCFYCEKDKVLFAGDTLFASSHGRTDFPGGSYEDMVKSLKRLAKLPEDVTVLPGHEGFTMICREAGWIERL